MPPPNPERTVRTLLKATRIVTLLASVALISVLYPQLASATEVALLSKGGVYTVPVAINGVLTLNFIIDSGASEVQIPADVVLTLVRTQTILPTDFLPGREYSLADGSVVKSPRFVIRELRIADHRLTNVTASISAIEGEPLLGQSLLT
jgi:predicted aspartyl protease